EIMLLDTALAVDARQRLTRIVANVDHIVASLESARSMARDQPRPAEQVDLATCMDDAWRGLEVEADAAGLSFYNRIPAGAAYLLDRYALLTVLRNLVRNAIEHAAPATLTAALMADGTLELRDTGKGIATEELPFVFQRYYSGRLDDTPGALPDDGGFPRGLGLAIAKRVCDMQGWHLQVESERGGEHPGARFLLRLC
ncbi:MAG TPA: HAMP domain-containing sensor histidine kinase, partial [Bordetella sp.]|nr:HAMP domain-containing sensor histidine kinase [Bordetella sp.]